MFFWTGPVGATLVTRPHSYVEPRYNSGAAGEGGDESSGKTASGWNVTHDKQPPFWPRPHPNPDREGSTAGHGAPRLRRL